MSQPTDSDALDKTVLAPAKAKQDERPCPFCAQPNPVEALAKNNYACRHCRKELAHLDYAPNGSLRGIFGWLLTPGEVVLERYKIQSVLGKGGFGAAYLADDLQLSGKRRALKEVPSQMFDEYETNLLSRLDHPAIPDIIERRAVGDMFYLVLKFGGSRTLGSERKQHADGRVPLEKLLTWMRQLCEVLIYLHTQTPPIIHRDLKPDNILLDENERIMLIDFGIAKEAVPEAMTRTLGRAATMHFSPPEQVMGTGTDERADIYALGATFYALLTGQNPPAAPERVSGKELTPPSELVADLPPELDDAIMQALELNMNHRQQSVREFAQALDGLVYSENSRPLRSEAETGRTQLMGGQATQQTQNKSAGLKIPTGRAATARNRSAPIAPVEAAAPPPNKMPLIVGGAVLALLALAAGVFWWQSSKTGEKPETAVVSPQSPPVSNPLAQPPVAAPVAPQPVPATPQTPPPVPAQQVTPPSAEPAQAPAGSAEEILRNSRKPEVVEPPATPTPEPEPAPSKPKPKPKPKPAPDPVAPKPSRHKLTPSPPPPAPEQWKIIPGGARKTD